MSTAADIIAIIRDVLFISILLISTVAVLLLFKTIKGLLGSVRRTVDSVEEITGTISDRIVAPATSGSGVAFSVGKMFSFVLGMLKREKEKEKEGGESDGK